MDKSSFGAVYTAKELVAEPWGYRYLISSKVLIQELAEVRFNDELSAIETAVELGDIQQAADVCISLFCAYDHSSRQHFSRRIQAVNEWLGGIFRGALVGGLIAAIAGLWPAMVGIIAISLMAVLLDAAVNARASAINRQLDNTERSRLQSFMKKILEGYGMENITITAVEEP